MGILRGAALQPFNDPSLERKVYGNGGAWPAKIAPWPAKPLGLNDDRGAGMATTFAAGTTGAERYNSRMTPKEGELPRDWHPLLDELHAALVAKMEADGLSVRATAEAIGLPHTTLIYFLRRSRGLAWNNASAVATFIGLRLDLAPLPRPKTRKPKT